MYRNRGDYAQAAVEYARAIPLIERGGDPTLIQETQTLISLTGLYLRIGDRSKSVESVRNAIDLVVRYAKEPRRYLPPQRTPPRSIDLAGCELIGLLASTPAVPADSAIVEYVLVEHPAPTYYAFVIREIILCN